MTDSDLKALREKYDPSETVAFDKHAAQATSNRWQFVCTTIHSLLDEIERLRGLGIYEHLAEQSGGACGDVEFSSHVEKDDPPRRP